MLEMNGLMTSNHSALDKSQGEVKKLTTRLNTKLKQFAALLEQSTNRMNEFERDTKEALTRMEDGLIDYTKISIRKVENKVVFTQEEI